MTNETQRFDIEGSPGSGKFTLAFRDAITDPPLAYHPAAGVVQSALEALDTIGLGNVAVTKDGNWGYVCVFLNALGDQDVPLLEADGSLLGGGGTITVSIVREGGPEEVPPPVDGGTGVPDLATPCTVADLNRFVFALASVVSGGYHNVPVTSDENGIYIG